MTDEPEPRFSKADLGAIALLIAVIGGLGGLWYAEPNTHFLRDHPEDAVVYIFFVGLPFFVLAFGGVRALRIWAGAGAASLIFWCPIFWLMRSFTT